MDAFFSAVGVVLCVLAVMIGFVGYVSVARVVSALVEDRRTINDLLVRLGKLEHPPTEDKSDV